MKGITAIRAASVFIGQEVCSAARTFFFSNSNDRGRAYEYAWINALYDALKSVRNTAVVQNSSLETNKRAWTAIDEDLQELFDLSATAAVNTILELEPRMAEKDEDQLLLEFQKEFQKDEAGTKGDVRDIVIRHDSIK